MFTGHKLVKQNTARRAAGRQGGAFFSTTLVKKKTPRAHGLAPNGPALPRPARPMQPSSAWHGPAEDNQRGGGGALRGPARTASPLRSLIQPRRAVNFADWTRSPAFKSWTKLLAEFVVCATQDATNLSPFLYQSVKNQLFLRSSASERQIFLASESMSTCRLIVCVAV